MIAPLTAYTGDKWRNDKSTSSCPSSRDLALKNPQIHSDPAAWIPDCEKDGSFKIYQKNISGTPFCATSKGVKAFQPKDVKPTTVLKCECPSQLYELLTSKCTYIGHNFPKAWSSNEFWCTVRRPGTFIPLCDANGKYRSVQCRPGNPSADRAARPEKRLATCYCADENGKSIGEKPITMEDSYCDRLRSPGKN